MSNSNNKKASLREYARALPQHLMPHHGLSALMHLSTRIRWRPFKNWQIRWVSKKYQVNLDETPVPHPHDHSHFNSFFTRALKPGARPLPKHPGLVACPADGKISQIGYADNDRLLQAKGQTYSLTDLLGGDVELGKKFAGGAFITVYLSPRDYHRVHMANTGRLLESIHVPGRLFSVAPLLVRTVSRIFARNERLVTLWDTPHGLMAQIMVGAVFVGSIETVWGGIEAPLTRKRKVDRRHDGYQRPPVNLVQGDEMGRFNMGSTVICLFAPGTVEWDKSLHAEQPVRMGQVLGRFTSHS